MEPKHYPQIDVLKGIAIIFVIVLHSVGGRWLSPIFSFLYVNIAVPIFMIILGLNSGLSFRRYDAKSLKGLYSKEYFKSKFNRIAIPYIIAYFISIVILLSFKNTISVHPLIIVGYMPTGGLGNYFVILLFQFVLIFPLIYYNYRKNPKQTILACFLVNFLFQISFYFIPAENENIEFLLEQIHKNAILRLLSFVVMGLWISDKYEEGKLIPFFKEHKTLILAIITSIAYLIVFNRFFDINAFLFVKNISFAEQNIFSVFYPVFIILLGITFLPKKLKKNKQNLLARVGKASYHVLIVQMLYFKILYTLNPLKDTDNFYIMLLNLVTSLIYCTILGILFYEFDRKFLTGRLTRQKKKD